MEEKQSKEDSHCILSVWSLQQNVKFLTIIKLIIKFKWICVKGMHGCVWRNRSKINQGRKT